MAGRIAKYVVGVAPLALSCVLAPTAFADSKLVAATQCPQTGPNRACVMTDITPPRTACSLGPAPYAQAYTVRGRLNGAPPHRYRFELTQENGARPVAYLGQSPARRALMLTDKGVLEILDPKWNPGSPPYYIVDERSWKITGRFYNGLGSDPIVTSTNDIGYWDASRELCISPLLEPGRRLRIIEGGCAARPPKRETEDNSLYKQRSLTEIALQGLSDWLAQYEPRKPHPAAPPKRHWLGNVEPAPVSFGRVRKLLPKDAYDSMGAPTDIASEFGANGTGIDIVRIKNAKTLILIVSYDGDGC